MTSSTNAAGRYYAELRSRLSPLRLHAEVDEPLAAAAAHFPLFGDQPLTVAAFHETLTAFIQHLFADALRPAHRLTDDQALAEALALIADAYPVTTEPRYEAACFDACDPDGAGIERVLQCLREALQRRARLSWVRWVVADTLGGADWDLRVALVEVLRVHAPHLLAGRRGTLSTAELAPLVVRLICDDAELPPEEQIGLGWLRL